MIIFLYGEDDYRSREKLNEIVNKFKKTNKGTSLVFFNGKKDKFQKVKDGLITNTLFKDKKIIFLNNCFQNKELEENILDFLKKNKETEELIIFYEKEVDKRKSLFKYLNKNFKCQEFVYLEGQKLRSWIKKEFEQYKTEVDMTIIEVLIRLVGSDLWRLSNEIKKISLYSKGEENKISKHEIELLISSEVGAEIFETIDAIASKNKNKALDFIHYHQEKGDSPLYLFSMIKYQISNLLVVKDLYEKRVPFGSIISKTGLHPFVVKKSYGLSQKFDLDQLKKLYKKLFKFEIKMKTGKIDPSLALDLLIAEI